MNKREMLAEEIAADVIHVEIALMAVKDHENRVLHDNWNKDFADEFTAMMQTNPMVSMDLSDMIRLQEAMIELLRSEEPVSQDQIAAAESLAWLSNNVLINLCS